MPFRRRWQTFRERVVNFFSPRTAIRDGPQRRERSGSFFNNAHHFTIRDPVFVDVSWENIPEANRQEILTRIMHLLSQHIIHGAAHDSSARTPPPRCHPDTRVKLIARITTWFEGQGQQELLLWLTGPAGVGKSAIVQTFAEHLAKLKLLGASVFFSRPNKRNNPHGIFITIAYQLATRIPEYRKFVLERLCVDPELLNGDVQAQFATFIVEPFVEKEIGAGGPRWGILLDGLDELQGEDAQRDIIELIGTFVHQHHDVPLVWIIASRPESHISNTFNDDDIRHSYWKEYVPIDSTEACDDVERYLQSCFELTKKKFRHSVPPDWPSSADFLKLTATASGLFVFAEVIMRFIRDPDLADPVSQLEVLLSVINRSNVVPTQDNPFLHLDAFYHEILSLIHQGHWSTVKQLLGFTIYADRISLLGSRQTEPGSNALFTRKNLQTPRGMSIIFGIPHNAIYSCLTRLRSTLKIPSWKNAHEKHLMFLHASFADYLSNPNRSGIFYVGDFEDVAEEVLSRLVAMWNECSEDGVATASVKFVWHRHCLGTDGKTPSRAIAKFHDRLFHDVVYFVGLVAYRVFETPKESPTYEQLRRVHMIKLCYYLNVYGLLHCVRNLLECSEQFDQVGLLREVRFHDLKLGHLDWKEMSPARVRSEQVGEWGQESDWRLHRPRSRAKLQAFVADLKFLKECSPGLRILIFGGVPSGRVAVFRWPVKEEPVDLVDFMFYMIPYPE